MSVLLDAMQVWKHAEPVQRAFCGNKKLHTCGGAANQNAMFTPRLFDTCAKKMVSTHFHCLTKRHLQRGNLWAITLNHHKIDKEARQEV